MQGGRDYACANKVLQRSVSLKGPWCLMVTALFDGGSLAYFPDVLMSFSVSV